MQLKERIENLEKCIHEDDNYLTEYETAKRDFEHLQKQKANGITISSRAQYVEYGEKK